MGSNPRLEDGPSRDYVGYGLVHAENFLYLFGGETGDREGFWVEVRDIFFQHDLRTGKWTDLQSASSGVSGSSPISRSAHVFEAFKGDLFLHGGLEQGTIGGGSYTTLLRYASLCS